MNESLKSLSETQKHEEIMLRLKIETKPLHDSTETHQFQKVLGTGKIKRSDYISYLEQLFLIHSNLAEKLKERSSDPKIGSVLKDRHTCVLALSEDLSCFAVATEKIVPLKATEKFINKIEEIAQESAISLLGILYVLEGSTHGAKYMAKNLRAGLNLIDRNGSSYFDRYGEEQMNFWLQFKKDMNNQPFTEKEKSEIINLAKETFNTFSEIGTEILAKSES